MNAAPADVVREFYSFDELIDSEHQEPQYAVEDLLIEGHHGIIAGPYASGKTFLVSSCRFHLRRGWISWAGRSEGPTASFSSILKMEHRSSRAAWLSLLTGPRCRSPSGTF